LEGTWSVPRVDYSRNRLFIFIFLKIGIVAGVVTLGFELIMVVVKFALVVNDMRASFGRLCWKIDFWEL
jgi:hypothetical protein